MLLGLVLFLAGPRTMNKDFTESSHDVFTLEPHGNKTVSVPLSLEQAFYMVSAHNLVLRNVVLVEINGSRPFTVYQLKNNTTVKLAEHTLFYSLNLSDFKARLVVENEADVTISVKINIEHVLTVKIADFTIPHVGFIIFITTLLTLQFLSVATNGGTLIVGFLYRKLRRKNIDAQKTFLEIPYGLIAEILFPISVLGLVVVLTLMFSGRLLSLMENAAGYVFDILARFGLIITFLGYFLTLVFCVSDILLRNFRDWILKRKGQEYQYPEMNEEDFKAVVKKVTSLAVILLIAVIIMIVYEFELKIILGTAICISLILYAIAYHIMIKQLQTRLGRDSFNENLVGSMEINAKTIGLLVLGIIAILPAFIMMMPLFSALTSNMLLLEFYPSFIYEFAQSSVSWVNDAFTLLRQLQALLCLIVACPYWIMRVIICKFKAKYKSKLLTDIAIFFAVFTISEYLKWTYSFFTQNQPYDIASLPISILIGMTASILGDLLTEVQPK